MHLHECDYRRPRRTPLCFHCIDVALNTSVLHVGQAVGSAIGGVLYARDLLYGAGYVSVSFAALALLVVICTSRLSANPRV